MVVVVVVVVLFSGYDRQAGLLMKSKSKNYGFPLGRRW